MNIKPLEVIKKHLGDDADAATVELYTGVKMRTLFNWFNEDFKKFFAAVMGAKSAIAVCKRLPNQVERDLIEIRLREFIENGGEIKVYEPLNLQQGKPAGVRHDD